MAPLWGIESGWILLVSIVFLAQGAACVAGIKKAVVGKSTGRQVRLLYLASNFLILATVVFVAMGSYDLFRAARVFGTALGSMHISYTIARWVEVAAIACGVALWGYVWAILLEFMHRILRWRLSLFLLHFRWWVICIAAGLGVGIWTYEKVVEPTLKKQLFFESMENALMMKVISDCDRVVLYKTKRIDERMMPPPPPDEEETDEFLWKEMLRDHFNQHEFEGRGVEVDRRVMRNLLFQTDVYHHTYNYSHMNAGYLVRFVRGENVLDLWINEKKDVWVYLNRFESKREVLDFQRPYEELMESIHGDAGSRLLEYGPEFFESVDHLYFGAHQRIHTVIEGG